jgi:CDP-diacylglycerol---glycerol-3-phosphate 3-phosphatidyltransferase
VVPVAVFLAQFVVVDAFLSMSFLAWPLRSPNYFDLVEPRVFALNWSKAGKAVNSGALALLLIFTDSFWLPMSLVVAVLAVKCWSVVLVARLDPPGRAGCAARAAAPALA